MPHDRALLMTSMALQGAVSLTFGVAFLGWWKGFHRPMAMRWGTAWFAYGWGVAFPPLIAVLGLFGTIPPLARALLPLPLQLSVVLFFAGAESATRSGPLKATRYVIAGVITLAALSVLRELQISSFTGVQPALALYITPRATMGLTFAAAAWQLRHLARRRWAEGYSLMAAALLGLSILMFASVWYELSQAAAGAVDRPENPLLTVFQICLLIAFGIATALVLVEAERLEAVRAAIVIRETAEALRESEARFRFVVEHTSDVQMIVGADQRIRYVAPSCERVVGLPATALERLAFTDFVHPDDRQHAVEAFARMLGDPSVGHQSMSVRIRHRSGEWLPVDVSGRAVADGGVETTVVMSVRDMTEQRRLEAALRNAGRMDSLGRMAGNIAHDFNNTLTAILAGLDLAMLNVAADSPARRHLEIVQNAAARGTAFPQHLLGFARQLPAASKQFNVGDRLSLLEGLIGMAVGRGIRVRITAADQPAVVSADADQFDQVMMNLAVNARDAMPSGGSLSIRWWIATASEVGLASPPRDATPEYVRILVEDTGSGIPESIVHRIFEPFFTTKRQGAGTGLGLASAYGFAQQSGGCLSVNSREGTGARFYLDLPRDVAVAKSDTLAPAPRTAPLDSIQVFGRAADSPSVPA